MNKRLAKAAAFVVIASLAVGAIGNNSTVSKAAKVKLSKSKATLKAGDSIKLKVKNYKGKVKWSSSKKKVASVSKKGVVTAKKKGKAVITAKAGAKKLTCKVTVKNAKAEVSPSAAPSAQTTSTPQAPVQNTPIPDKPANPTPEPTNEPTKIPEPTATPKYMQEGAFVYDKLDISWINPKKPMIAFTFDDGPVGSADSDYSMRILNVLKEYGMHATFNYVTSKISNDSMKQEILTSMENGNEIANHTSQWSSLSDLNAFPDGEAIAAEVEKARAALEELTGITNFTLRPPNLGQNALVLENVNVPLIGCNIISNDWETSVTKEHIIEVTKKAKDGDIVLFHETMQHTAEAVEELVPYFVEQGYQIVSVSELFAAKDIPLFRGNYYNKAEYMEPKF